ncbi:uncharacterized protein LOC127724931 [Mytilus californianus]|uniref:uncharacterized protein LOC127724931 n=1 Tax=Mytilus californianus TaxID=6549 RepID=UPI002246C471|nr:uncharacterized protein LOC127724931 [Mytilus californianus]
MHLMNVNRNQHLLKIEYARSSRSQCKSILGCSKIAEGDLRIGVVHDTWPWTEWYHFDCFWGDAFEEFFNDNRDNVEDVDIEDLMEGYRSLSEDDQENADDSLETWINICKGGDDDEDDVSFVTTEVENQTETSGNDENGNNKNNKNLPKDQNGNKTLGNDMNGNVENKENLPKDQNGNKTSGKDEKKVLVTKRITEPVNKGLKREIDPVPKVPEKKIRILNSFVGFL